MKYFVIFLSLVTLFMIALNPVSAQCAYDPSQPHKPCDDVFGTLIIETHEAKIENIDGQLFHVIGPFSLEQESNDRIRFDGVIFTYPSYPNPSTPGGPVSITITFENGSKENIFKVGAPLPFIEFVGVDPQAGVRRNADGMFDFLLSVEQQLISPLKQFKSGVPIDEIQCKESLILVTKYDGSPACVTLETKEKLLDRGWVISNDNDFSFDVVTPESSLAIFYAQPQLTSIILKQDSTVRVHLFSYLKESDSDEWDHVFDRIFDEVPKNFKIGIVENTPNNINEFVTLGKENLPSGIRAELSREQGYFVVYLTSNKLLEPKKYDLSIVSIDKVGTVIQKPLHVIAMNADMTSTQDNIVKIRHSNYSWGIDLENISEQEYWIREDSRSPWPPSPILDITQDNIHPHVKELIDAMWSQNAKYVPSKYDQKILLVENVTDLNVDPQKIRDWLETTYVQQFKRNLDDSFSSYIKYDDKIYSFGFVIAD